MKRRRGRRALAHFENLPVTTHVYELSGPERACPCCGEERKEIGAEKSWQIEYLPGHFERLQHVRKKYACAHCEARAQGPQIQVAARQDAALERGLAGPGLLAYIVTSKFADYLPLYRLEDIFARQDSKLRAPRRRSGAGTWPTWSNPCTAGWSSVYGSRTWWRRTIRCCPC